MKSSSALHELSIIVPVYDEKSNIPILYKKIVEASREINRDFEVIFINDGSRDGSGEQLDSLAANDKRVKIIHFRRNFGQTAAISAGIDYSRGDILVLMDADLQNDPSDIPKLLDGIEKGYDVVSGWRKNRKDPFFTRRLPSYLANKLISWITGVKLNDYGCTLKAYRQDVLENVRLYGEMHRFIPAFASWVGASINEIEVTHYARIHGNSKYGISRTFKTILDLLTVKFIIAGYSAKPLYVFGGIGMVLLLISSIIGLFITIRAIFFLGEWISPMILIASVLTISSIQFVLMGLLAEMISRTYFESQSKPTYLVRKTVNMEAT